MEFCRCGQDSVCKEVLGAPVIVLPAVVVAKEENAPFLVRARHPQPEKPIQDSLHLPGNALEEHANASLEQAVSREDHLVHAFFHALYPHDEHVVGRRMAGRFEGFQGDASPEEVVDRSSVVDRLRRHVYRLVSTANDSDARVGLHESVIVPCVVPMLVRRDDRLRGALDPIRRFHLLDGVEISRVHDKVGASRALKHLSLIHI